MTAAESVFTHAISASAAAAVTALTEDLARTYQRVDNPELVARAPELASLLPGDVRAACSISNGQLGFQVISGFEIDDTAIGPTPQRWQDVDPYHTAAWDILMLLLANVIGVPFGWSGQQQGRLVNNILPARGHEHLQTGASSTTLLEPHTEDAFHPGRCQKLVLAAMRNHDDIGTTISSVREVELEPAEFVELASAVLPILPDDSYETGSDGTVDDLTVIPTLWVRGDGLCLRFDPAYTPLPSAPRRYRAAYERLSAGLEAGARTVSLRAGEVLIIDNDVVVHGRVPFTPRYDGTDRWLKRINVHQPDNDRPAAEQFEDGYGQDVVDPLGVHPVYSERSSAL